VRVHDPAEIWEGTWLGAVDTLNQVRVLSTSYDSKKAFRDSGGTAASKRYSQHRELLVKRFSTGFPALNLFLSIFSKRPLLFQRSFTPAVPVSSSVLSVTEALSSFLSKIFHHPTVTRQLPHVIVFGDLKEAVSDHFAISRSPSWLS
jgi:hypothetical protein